MPNHELENTHVAVLVMDGVEEAEIVGPLKALTDAGAVVDIISEELGEIRAFNGHAPARNIGVDKTFRDVSPSDYHALFLPGGALNADALRVVPEAQAFAAAFDNADKPIAAICHAAWLLVSSDLLDGRILTSYHTIHDDIENAGGIWLDEAVVSDGNLLTSRQPSDIPVFIERMIQLFANAHAPTRLQQVF